MRRCFISKRPIGIFDSGLGGLSIFREIQKNFPKENLIYIADTLNCPYGPKTNQEISQLVTDVTNYLVEQNCKAIVIACNTATANSNHLKLEIPVIGMILPTVLETVRTTKNNNVLVLATEATVRSELYSSNLKKHNIVPIELAVPEFVLLVENSKNGTEEAQKVVETVLKDFLDKSIDTVVLGCTHFGFLKTEIQKVLPSSILVDGSQEVSLQLKQQLAVTKKIEKSSQINGKHTILYTGESLMFIEKVRALNIKCDEIKMVKLKGGSHEKLI